MNLGKKVKKTLFLLILCVFSIGTFNSKPAMAVNTGFDPYIGQISLFPYNFEPMGWAECRGQVLPISSNQALFALIGVNFGGDGRTTFKLPDLQNSSPIPGAKYYIAIQGIFPSRSDSPYDYSGMSEVTGAINLFPYNFVPPGWAFCNGQDLDISQSTDLYSLIGTTYGGDGVSTYRVPDLTNAITKKYGVYGLQYAICVNGIYPDRSMGSGGDDFLGNIDLYAFKFNSGASRVAECTGQNFAISSNQALFALLGVNYGGNGISNFGIPDLRGAVPSPKMGYYISTVGIFPSRS